MNDKQLAASVVNEVKKAVVGKDEMLIKALLAILSEEKRETDRVTFSGDTLRRYCPKSYTPQRMQETILKLLEQWQKRREDRSR